MISFTAIAILILHITFVITFLVIASLSKIFGAARKKKELYKLYYLASVFVTLSMVVSLLGINLNYLEYATIGLDVIGLTIACAVTYFYWDWLPRELARG